MSVSFVLSVLLDLGVDLLPSRLVVVQPREPKLAGWFDEGLLKMLLWMGDFRTEERFDRK